MISALAARKAKAQSSSSRPASPPLPAASLGRLQEDGQQSLRPQKRKTSPQPVGNTATNRQKKRRALPSQPRYFDDQPKDTSDPEILSPPSNSPSLSPQPLGTSDHEIDSDLEELPNISVPLPSVLPEELPERFLPVPRSRIKIAEDNQSCTVTLHPGEQLYLLGTYEFRVISGLVSFYGSTQATTVQWSEVYAPNFFPVPYFQPLAQILSTKSMRSSTTASDLLPPESCVLEIRPFRTRFPNLWKIIPPFKDSFSFPQCEKILDGVYLVPPPTKLPLLTINSSWDRALLPEGSEQPTIHLVKGPRNSGKSTFARVLLNRLLGLFESVAYLDTDLGQAEFTPSGFVGLFIVDKQVYGPPFTHPKIPINPRDGQAHYLGMLSPKSSPSQYLAAVRACIEEYFESVRYPTSPTPFASRRRWPTESQPPQPIHGSSKRRDLVPLVINTQGWTKGLGSDLLRHLTDMLVQFLPTTTGSAKPLDVRIYDMSPSHPPGLPSTVLREVVDGGLPVVEVEPFTTTTTTGGMKARYSAADLRNLMLMSYFFSTAPAPHVPLARQLPYALSPSQTIDRIVLTGARTEDVGTSEIGRVLIGALVGLVECHREAPRGGPQTHTLGSFFQPGSPPPEPKDSQCIGLAFIRSVAPSLVETTNRDDDDRCIHVLTPVAPDLLANGLRKNVIKGEIEMPIWGWLPPSFASHSNPKEDTDWDVIPYLQFSKADGLGGDKRRVRRGLMRRGQM